MCFKNLPVEFDAQGRASLRGGIPDPYSVTITRPDVAMTDAEREAQIKRLMKRNGHIRELNMDPVTRVAGALAVNVTADFESGRYLDARSQATVVRSMGEAAEMGYDNPLHLYLLAGPDYSEVVVKAVNPELWSKAERWQCPNEDHHGFNTMAEL